MKGHGNASHIILKTTPLGPEPFPRNITVSSFSAQMVTRLIFLRIAGRTKASSLKYSHDKFIAFAVSLFESSL